jgi:hypothetical protein
VVEAALRACQRYGYDQPIPAGRRKYCSDRCGNITRRDAYRACHPERILAQDRSYYERMPQAVYERHLRRNCTRRRAEAAERAAARMADLRAGFRFGPIAS